MHAKLPSMQRVNFLLLSYRCIDNSESLTPGAPYICMNSRVPSHIYSECCYSNHCNKLLSPTLMTFVEGRCRFKVTFNILLLNLQANSHGNHSKQLTLFVFFFFLKLRSRFKTFTWSHCMTCNETKVKVQGHHS